LQLPLGYGRRRLSRPRARLCPRISVCASPIADLKRSRTGALVREPTLGLRTLSSVFFACLCCLFALHHILWFTGGTPGCLPVGFGMVAPGRPHSILIPLIRSMGQHCLSCTLVLLHIPTLLPHRRLRVPIIRLLGTTPSHLRLDSQWKWHHIMKKIPCYRNHF
jgi:hypothetical protein